MRYPRISVLPDTYAKLNKLRGVKKLYIFLEEDVLGPYLKSKEKTIEERRMPDAKLLTPAEQLALINKNKTKNKTD